MCSTHRVPARSQAPSAQERVAGTETGASTARQTHTINLDILGFSAVWPVRLLWLRRAAALVLPSARPPSRVLHAAAAASLFAPPMLVVHACRA